MRNRARFKTKTKFIFFLILILAVGGMLAGLSSFVQNAAAAHPPANLQNLDAIVVLTGGTNRIDTGFDLLEHGYGKKLFISGVSHGLDVNKLLKRWKAEPQRSLDCCVMLGFEAGDTAGNATETVEWLRKENFHSLYLVTANYHIQRAMLKFQALAPDLAITPYPVVPDKVDVQKWWQDPTTRSLMLREYLKYAVTRLWHMIPH